jgi:hypothetical protein
MRKTFFIWLFIAATFFASGQGKTLYTVNFVKPKPGMKSTFEANWKTHLAKFHKTSDKRNVFEIVSGARNGTYCILEGPISYADMDVDKPMAKEHGLDLEKSFSPFLEDNTMNGTYRWDDTASFNSNVTAEKFLVTVTHIKFGQQVETLREARRLSLIFAKLPTPPPISFNFYTQIWAGSDPVTVSVRNLKDGFKELENNFFGANNPNPPNAFRDAYIKAYGYDAWDARSKLLDNNANIASREAYIMKLRKDLSSE